MTERKPEQIGSVLRESFGLPLSTRECEHPRAEPRRRIISGQPRPWLQCPDCGTCRALKLVDYPSLDSLPEFQENLRDEIWSAQSEAWEERRAAEREQRKQEWFEDYSAYLRSPEWRKRRTKVLKRAGGICESCLERPAAQVHHTTYQHVKNEPLWELRAVCHECHELITKLDRKEAV